MRAHFPRVVDVTRPFAAAKIRLRKGDCNIDAGRKAQQKIRSRVAATLGVGCRIDLRVIAGEKELTTRELVTDLREFVIPVLPTHAQRVLADDPREVIDA